MAKEPTFQTTYRTAEFFDHTRCNCARTSASRLSGATRNKPRVVTGAVQPKLNQANLCRVPFMMPSESVCSEFERCVSPLFVRMRQNTDESKTLAASRDALLPKLLSGELRVRDADRAVGKVL